MTLVQLEYALAVQKSGSYGRAAKAVGISQPGMSIQVRKLEEEIGLTLFDRTQKKIRTTSAGEIFLERAQLLLTQARQLEELAHVLNAEFRGTLKIGVIPTLAPYLLPLFIQHLNEQFPDLNIHVQEAITEEIVHGIKAGEFDAGIISTPINTSLNLSIHPLFYEAFFWFVSNMHPLFKKEEIPINQVPLDDIWLLKEGNCLRNQIDNICDINAHREQNPALFYFESNSIESLCRIVEIRGGITLLPELTTLHFDSEREAMIKKLAGPKRVREISLIHLQNHVRKDVIGEIGELIKRSIPRKLLEKGELEALHTNVSV